jgi:DNA-directed RNA polymerase I, II, and III subunit RPABC1
MQRLLNIKQTQLQLVADRGYDISPERQILDMNANEFKHYLETNSDVAGRGRAGLSRIYYNSDQTRRMLVYYGSRTSSDQKQIPSDVIKEFVILVQRYRIDEAILIVDVQISTTGNGILNDLTLTQWQVFHDDQLTYNPTHHIMTPRHELIPREEEIQLLRDMRADKSQLTIIQSTDPIVKYYGWQIGGIVRIYRDDISISILANKTINYRVIVAA